MFARRLGREITTLILIKAAALIVLFCLFFGPEQRLHVDSQRMNDQILSEQSKP